MKIHNCYFLHELEAGSWIETGLRCALLYGMWVHSTINCKAPGAVIFIKEPLNADLSYVKSELSAFTCRYVGFRVVAKRSSTGKALAHLNGI